MRQDVITFYGILILNLNFWLTLSFYQVWGIKCNKVWWKWQDVARCYNFSRSLGTKFKVVIDTMFLRFVRCDNVLRRLYAKFKVDIYISFLSKMGGKV